MGDAVSESLLWQLGWFCFVSFVASCGGVRGAQVQLGASLLARRQPPLHLLLVESLSEQAVGEGRSSSGISLCSMVHFHTTEQGPVWTLGLNLVGGCLPDAGPRAVAGAALLDNSCHHGPATLLRPLLAQHPDTFARLPDSQHYHIGSVRFQAILLAQRGDCTFHVVVMAVFMDAARLIADVQDELKIQLSSKTKWL